MVSFFSVFLALRNYLMVPYVIIEWSLIPEILRIPKVLKLAPIGDYLKLFTRIWAYLSGVGGGGYFEGGAWDSR